MRMSRLFMPTMREIPTEAEIISHQLMMRAALINKNAAGVYQMLPLGYRTFRKIEAIIRQEMEAEGAQELFMSALNPAELYMDSGRWAVFGPEMWKLKDRNGRDFGLGPTHEEAFTVTFRQGMRSYRDMPATLYQIQTKFRDERRPRFGVMRSREFIMKDAYSFDRDETGLDASYQAMARAYRKIFARCGLNFLVVDADSGAMGGSGSQEFMVTSDIGEAVIARCVACGYAANDEKAVCLPPAATEKGEALPLEKVATPDARTIEELVAFFNTDATHFAKTMLYRIDESIVAVLVRGDREINETKLSNLFGGAEVQLADAETVFAATQAAVGFAGPIGLKANRVIADYEVQAMHNFVIGANDTGYHYKNAVFGRDFTPDTICDIRNIATGDACPVCGKPIDLLHGIEVGHIFKLGDKYTRALDVTYLDESGKQCHPVMGSYGIGLNRTMAAVIEQNNDADGIIWPMSVAPYHVVVVPARNDSMEVAEDIYQSLLGAQIEALLDDRDERAGVKFKDCDLIGIPLRITVGKKAADGIVELKSRDGKLNEEIAISELLAHVQALIAAQMR